MMLATLDAQVLRNGSVTIFAGPLVFRGSVAHIAGEGD